MVPNRPEPVCLIGAKQLVALLGVAAKRPIMILGQELHRERSSVRVKSTFYTAKRNREQHERLTSYYNDNLVEAYDFYPKLL